MFGTAFGHDLIKKYVIYFGTLFNNLHLNRYDNSGNLIQSMKVPLNYGPREKFLARVDGNKNDDRQIAIQLPRLSFEITNIYYDSTRARNRLNTIKSPNHDTFQYAPAPWNIDFTLSVMVKNAQDGTYILEQILPYFTPDFTSTLKLNPDMDTTYDVPLSINTVSPEDTYEGVFEARRALIWTLTFTMRAWMFGPTQSSGGKVIKEIDINFNIPPSSQSIQSANTTNNTPVVSMQITPGQNPDGEPVSWYGAANATNRPETVDHKDLNTTDEWAFVTDFTKDT